MRIREFVCAGVVAALGVCSASAGTVSIFGGGPTIFDDFNNDNDTGTVPFFEANGLAGRLRTNTGTTAEAGFAFYRATIAFDLVALGTANFADPSGDITSDTARDLGFRYSTGDAATIEFLGDAEGGTYEVDGFGATVSGVAPRPSVPTSITRVFDVPQEERTASVEVSFLISEADALRGGQVDINLSMDYFLEATGLALTVVNAQAGFLNGSLTIEGTDVPAPGVLGVVAGAGLAAVRRRR